MSVSVLLSVLGCARAIFAAASEASDAHNRGVVLFVGDSNITLASEAIDWVTTWQAHSNNGYIPILASRVEATIRTEDCLNPVGCTTYNYWQIKLGELFGRVQPDAIVNDLGVNDTNELGTATTPGYADYGAKIDWFMRLLPAHVPVFWTNLPCHIEPPRRVTACPAVNAALGLATERWPNLVVINWAAMADGHPEWMTDEGQPGSVHYNHAGDRAWTNLVVKTLDAHFATPN